MAYENSLITPIININGTGKKELLEQMTDVLDALKDADDAMARAQPHGRDFQTFTKMTPAAATYAARRAWDERREALKNLRDDVLAHAMAISQQ